MYQIRFKKEKKKLWQSKSSDFRYPEMEWEILDGEMRSSTRIIQ